MALMFGFKKKSSKIELLAPSDGAVIDLSDTSDPVFSTGAMGIGFGLEPTDGSIYAPVAGKVTLIAETKHAIGFETSDGLQVLIHLGIDTVELKGRAFQLDVSQGQRVQAHTKLGTMNLRQIKAAGYKTTILTVITNSGELDLDFDLTTGETQSGRSVAQVTKK
ncbi:trehalose PTS II ABC [Ligilactobacillus acidipiscis DSM 15836]|uniref:Trehalose PTS II ABC n=3 Tax=Ligilactobacillus acidipiscis TaxID=89059 RepID=A0A0R2KCT4_9LACO|nr:trehalose PTS II ABC [Ligilactobacillus acidipiscis DSM 15836]KRN85189.1 trehalose PTS II ABC [Ligilactobacillus acidipiscis]